MVNLILWNSCHIEHAPVRTESCYQLASWVRQHGYSVKVIDFCHIISTQHLIAITEKYYGPETFAVGVSSNFWRPAAAQPWPGPEPVWLINARNELDSKISGIKWLLGGCSATLTSLRFNWIKFHGYAEDQLLKWMDEQASETKTRKLFDIKTTEKYYENDFIQPSEVLPIELGRGCQFKCKFCAYPLIGKKKGTYIREFDLIKEELIRNYNEFGVTRYYFIDETVNESEEKIRALAKIAQSLPFQINWTGFLRLDLIWSYPDTIKQLKDSGLKSAYFGIESFHQQASAVVGKGWNGKHGKEFLLKLKDEWKDEITWYLSLIAGLPHEPPDSLSETLDWCIKNKMYAWNFFPLNINRADTKIWKSEFELNYEKYGYTFPDEQNFLNWKTNIWSKPQAVAYAEILNNAGRPHVNPASWLLFEIISLGYSCEEIMHQHKINLPWSLYRNQTNKMLQNYVNFQIAA